jgi:hypothetical protein
MPEKILENQRDKNQIHRGSVLKEKSGFPDSITIININSL